MTRQIFKNTFFTQQNITETYRFSIVTKLGFS